MRATVLAAGAALLFAFGVNAASAASTLESVKARGHLKCGVSMGVPGFSADDGGWKGLDVDVCRAVAAAVLGDAGKVRYLPLTAQDRFPALQQGEIDVLSRVTTWTLTRDTQMGFNFAPTVYYDGQGFMVRRAKGAKSVRDLAGASICMEKGTTTEANLVDWFRTSNLAYTPIILESSEDVAATFLAGRCDAMTSDTSQLAAVRTTATNPDDYVILPELISREPLTPAVRHGDDQWFDIVKWSVYALFEAEEKGITAKTVDSFLDSKEPGIQRFLGVAKGNGAALGLDEKWAYTIVKQVGHYGESFERNVGNDSPLKLERGLNALWNKGGLHYAPAFR